jgi:hypothetical protein
MMFREINICYSGNYTNILKKLNSQLTELQFLKRLSQFSEYGVTK